MDLRRTSAQVREIAASELRERIAALRDAARELHSRPLRHIWREIDSIVESWLAPGSRWLEEAVRELPQSTGFSPAMIREGLPAMIEPLRAPALSNFFECEAGGIEALEDHADIPAVTGLILSGNITGLAVIPAMLATAVRSAVMIKAAGGDSAFPEMFVRSVRKVAPDLGRAVDACYWRGGNRACEQELFQGADVIVAYGSSATIADLRSRCDTRFCGYGSRISFAIVAREVRNDVTATLQAARDLAQDVALWDQRGCLSPQLCFVEGDFTDACRFGENLAVAFEAAARRLPPGATTFEERNAVRQWRDSAEWRRACGDPVRLWYPRGSADWTVIADSIIRFAPGPGSRSLRVMPIPDVEAIADKLESARGLLEAAGVACGAERRAQFERFLLEHGVNYVCSLGHMQRPPLAWRQGGVSRLHPWLGRG